MNTEFELTTVRDKTLTDAPAFVGELSESDKDLLASWILREQSRVISALVNAIHLRLVREVLHDAEHSSIDAVEFANRLDIRSKLSKPRRRYS